jgi:hypothetical protein
MHRSLTVLVLLTAASLSAGCGEDEPLPTPTPPAEITESFTGTLNPFSARNFNFVVQNPGSVTASVTALEPDSPTTVGISVGTWTGTACQVVVDRQDAVLNSTVTGTATQAGSICVRIYDSSENGLPAPVAFTLSVRHF